MTPHWQSEGVTLYQGDCRTILAQLPAGSVQTCVTSPPYYGLRSYSGGDLEIGAEGDLDAYIGNLVAVFAEVQRVLRDDGTVWLNLGDSYATCNPPGRRDSGGGKFGNTLLDGSFDWSQRQRTTGLKPKDLIGVPWRVAFALQADGWYLRNAIVWHKPNAMPESVRDRCSQDYEMVFLLSKRATYFMDMEAIKESASDSTVYRNGLNCDWGPSPKGQAGKDEGHWNGAPPRIYSTTRNKRSVWTVPTQPLRAINGIDHFAAFPEKLVEPMIKAGSSERGACGSCGSPFVRETRREAGDTEAFARPKHLQSAKSTLSLSGHAGKGWTGRGSRVHDAGFRPSCTCPPADPVPCVILDPFAGSGRSGVVARKLGRHFIGVDLNVSYCDLARAQISAVQPPLIGASA